MTALFGVETTPQAEDDLERLFEFLVARSETLEELDHAQHVLRQLRTSIKKRLTWHAPESPRALQWRLKSLTPP